MGASAAVGILHRKKLAAAPPGEREALHAQLAAEHEKIAGGVGRAMDIGVVDAIVAATANPPRPRRGPSQLLRRARCARQHPAVVGRRIGPARQWWLDDLVQQCDRSSVSSQPVGL